MSANIAVPSLSFATTMEASPELRPKLNLGALFDIQNGVWVLGEYGESILHGGLAPFVVIAGLPNTYKSTLLKYMVVTTMNNHDSVYTSEMETELSGSEARWESFASTSERLDPYNFIYHPTANPTGRLLRTDAAIYTGDRWWEATKKFADSKYENRKSKEVMGTLPIMGKDKKLMPAMYPSIACVDSFSRMNIASVDAIYDKNLVGESGNNAASLREMNAKNQIVIQMPVVSAQSSMYFICTAHVSEKYQLDPYAASVSKLSFLARNLKLKYVPDQLNFLAQDLYFVFAANKCVTKDKTPQYPRDALDNSMETTDLMSLTVMNLRGKSGLSGLPYEYIVSQTDGLNVGLSELTYLRQYGGYGIGGHDKGYYLELRPDVKLTRTTVRSKISEDNRLKQAFHFTSEMLQMRNLWRNLEPGLLCTPAELYEDLKKMGYDWDVLLNTRYYYTFKGHESDRLPFLSTMDLLRMRKGLYKPYWMS
jgi:hypothetical protein